MSPPLLLYSPLNPLPLFSLSHHYQPSPQPPLSLILLVSLPLTLLISPPSPLPRISTLGFLGSFLLSSHGWQSLFIVVGCSSLVWAVCLRFFSASNHHRTHYKLSDSVQPAASAHPQKLKLNVHPSAFMTSCGAVPWRELLAQPPVM